MKREGEKATLLSCHSPLKSGSSQGSAFLPLFPTCLESKEVNSLPSGQVLFHSLVLGLQPRDSIHLSQPLCALWGSGDGPCTCFLGLL